MCIKENSVYLFYGIKDSELKVSAFTHGEPSLRDYLAIL